MRSLHQLCLSLLFSTSQKEEPADVRAQEPHLRFRHGLHHQRHAHRGQSDAAQRHGVATPLWAGRSLHVHVCRWSHFVKLRNKNQRHLSIETKHLTTEKRSFLFFFTFYSPVPFPQGPSDTGSDRGSVDASMFHRASSFWQGFKGLTLCVSWHLCSLMQ